ncbi:MAG TPA: YncE family protein [Planctomycetota bacterium]
MTPASFRRALPLTVFLASLPLAQNALVNWETPHVSPLARTPDGMRLLAVNTPDNRLEVFDLGSGTPAALLSIPVGLDPVSVRARTSTEAWVVNHVSDSVSIVDLVAGHVVATLATDDEPCDVVFAGAPQRAFVSCSQANTVLVFDPADLAAAPQRVTIRGEDPRALAVSSDGTRVYAAIFESGNGTTILGGGAQFNIGFPPNVVDDPDGPHGGANPPPNAGAAFDPPIAAGLPTPPPVGLIVRRNGAGQWLDDNAGDWTAKVSGAQAADSGRPVGWVLLDHDVAILDASTLALSYADGLMNLNMALAVHPTSGAVSVVGTEATNEVRFEPRLSGTFVRSHLAGFLPANPAVKTVLDLNPHLDYQQATVAPAERAKSLADPRGIAWNAAGTRAYVTGMGSNNVVVLDASGQRAGLADTIPVGEGPTGIVVDDARAQLYVLNKFAATISVVSTASELETAQVAFFDPSPVAIRAGRRHLYDAHETSGTGVVACAACHVDARIDRLAWDLGDPSGAMKDVDASQNLGASVPGLNSGFEDWHPMKGPMLTQTLQDIIGKEPHHWRGDRDGLEEFAPAFLGLLGDDETLSATEMQEFEDFLATIHFPPNPHRNLDNSLPTDLALPGHYSTGRFGPAGVPMPNGNAVAGQAAFRPPNRLDGGALACVTCHTRTTGAGTDHRLMGFQFQPFPVGPQGEHHLALVSVDGSTNVTMKIPQLRNLYERTGFNLTQPEATAGFGYLHDGSVDSIERFIDEPAFTIANGQQTVNLTAFMLAFLGGTQGLGSPSNLQEPPGPSSQATHAAVGVQLTLDGPASVEEDARLDTLVTLANDGAVGLVAKGRSAGLARGWYYAGGDTFQSDRRTEILTRGALEALAAVGAELTFTVVPKVSERRIGVDRDRDGWFDRDELDRGTDPAEPGSHPRIQAVPAGRRP